MSDVDERLLTAAKMRMQAADDLDSNVPLLSEVGLVDEENLASIAFVEESVGKPFAKTAIGKEVLPKLIGQRATRALDQGNAEVLSHLVGVTETRYDGSAMTVTLELLQELVNDGAPAFVSIAGNPNTGKTNAACKLVEMTDTGGGLVDDVPEDVVVISNATSWDRVDVPVTSAHDLAVALLEHRDEDVVVVIDEASTHFDARTSRYEVASQWTPLAKRMAKLGVFAVVLITHTGKDLHPEAKRLTTLACWKRSQKEAEFYERWPADADAPADPLFADPVQDWEKADGYDPDDAAPWNWNLREDLFAEDLGWQQLLESLRDLGPAEE